MHKDLKTMIGLACTAGALALSGCSSDAKTASPTADAGCPGKDAGCPASDAGCPASDAGCPGTAGDPQTPGTGPQAEAWLAKGDYKTWKSEPAVHDSRSPSPHGKNRIFSNAKLSAHGAGEYPVGAGSVKELYDAAGTTIVGYAIGLKTKAGAGDAWYWYEKMGTTVVANGNGVALCTGCHSAAGTDAAHSGHDFVYTQVQ